MKSYKFNYADFRATVCLEVDANVFSKEHAEAVLSFWAWDYDKKSDPIEAAVKKCALECIRVSTINDFNTQGVISEFSSKEGWWPLDGSHGIELKYVNGIDWEDDDLRQDFD